jgi:hypothetical protein
VQVVALAMSTLARSKLTPVSGVDDESQMLPSRFSVQKEYEWPILCEKSKL